MKKPAETPGTEHPDYCSAGQVLAMLTTYGQKYGSGEYHLTKSRISEVQADWERISRIHDSKLLAPFEKSLIQAIQKPLAGARASFGLGYYAGAVAQFGYVAEMLTILLYKINRPELKTRGIEALKDSDAFEKERQGRRVNLLEDENVISAAIASALRTIGGLRNRHLHYFAPITCSPVADAEKMYTEIQVVLREVFKYEIVNDLVEMDPKIERFLESTSFIPGNKRGGR